MIPEQMLMSVSGSPSVGALRIGLRQPERVDVPVAARVEIDPVVTELRLLRAEVIALRADLASRTLTARLRRCWLWVRAQVDNLTTSA